MNTSRAARATAGAEEKSSNANTRTHHTCGSNVAAIRPLFFIVMPGLEPGIQQRKVDGRVKPYHDIADGLCSSRLGISWACRNAADGKRAPRFRDGWRNVKILGFFLN
jgi:hypothetical protein